MKTLITVLSLFITSFALSQDFEIKVVDKGSGTLGIEMRETSGFTPNTANFLVDLIFGIRWDSAYGINLNAPTGSYGIAKAGGETKVGAYEFQAYSASGTPFAFPADWTTGDWFEIASITSAFGGIGTGTFEICPPGFDITSEPYIDVDFNGVEPSLNGSATNVTLGTVITWDGDANNNNWFTASNWSSNTIPTQYQGISIPASLSFYPVLSNDVNIMQVSIANGATLSLNGRNLHVRGTLTTTGEIIGSTTSSLTFSGTGSSSVRMNQTGSNSSLANLTVATSGTVTISNSTEVFGLVTLTSGTLASGGNLRLGASSASVYGQIATSGSGTITGNLVMEKFLSNTSDGWRHFSMPLSSTLANFSGVDLLYSGQTNVFRWNATLNAAKATGWVAGASGSDHTLGGYTIYSQNGLGTHDIDQNISLTGSYTLANHTYALKETEDPGGSGADATGWNLIGNPFPTNLDLNLMFADWATNGNLAYEGIHIWDAVNQQYVAIMGSGTSIDYGTDGGDVGSDIISPFQAFWVKADDDEDFIVKTSYRTNSATGIGTFLKKDYDLARFNISNPNGKLDQAVVYFHDDATPGFDAGLDGYKLISMNNEMPSFYAVNDEGNFSITALNPDDFEHVVPMGFRSSVKGDMTLSLNTDKLDPKWYVYVEDKDLGIFYDLKAKPYTFDHTQNSDERFVLHFKTQALSAEKLVNDVKAMKVSGNGEEVFVFVPKHFRNQVYALEIYDLQGRLVYSNGQTELEHGMNTLNLNLENSGIYVIRVKAAEGMVSDKIQIF